MVACCKIELSFFSLMIVPENISSNGIAPHGLCHLNSMPPIFSWNPCGMHFTAYDLKRLPIKQEILRRKTERMFTLSKKHERTKEQAKNSNNSLHYISV